MSDVELSKRNQKINRWSWVIAMVGTMSVFFVSTWITLDVTLSAIVGAGVGIGMQFFIPYYTSLSVPAEQRSQLESSPEEGNIHQGAAGAAIASGSLAIFAAELVQLNQNVGLVIGLVVTVGGYFLFRDALP